MQEVEEGRTRGRGLLRGLRGSMSLVELRGDTCSSFSGSLLRSDSLLLAGSDLSVVGLLVESDEEEEVRGEESATENGSTFSSCARSGSRPGREVSGSEVGVG